MSNSPICIRAIAKLIGMALEDTNGDPVDALTHLASAICTIVHNVIPLDKRQAIFDMLNESMRDPRGRIPGAKFSVTKRD